MVITGKDELVMVLFGGFKSVNARQGGKVWANFLDFVINIDIEFLYALNELVEGRFHLFLNGIYQVRHLFTETKRQRGSI